MDESLDKNLKTETRLDQVYVESPLIRVVDNAVLLQKLSQSKGASTRTIIMLANIHVKTQYLYEGNQKRRQMGMTSEAM